jgi:lipid II:glycine glycyltransferase (peptidoglycan interpeptide bridge formation enzyme)
MANQAAAKTMKKTANSKKSPVEKLESELNALQSDCDAVEKKYVGVTLPLENVSLTGF